jgi:hypothetical protein
MNEPKRWDLWEVILEETDSTWVRWEDYAHLKAEVAIQNERINRRDMDVGQLYCENARLKAEVERLTKAGDAFVLLLEDEGYSMESIREVDGWNAAKEGKQP